MSMPALLALMLTAAPDEPPKPPAPPAAAKVKVPEFFEMFGSIVMHGADMGPTSSWFHPAESRYDWRRLATRCDSDGDGAITPDEWKASKAAFAVLDRDHDGGITPEDLDWSAQSPWLRMRGMARGAAGRMDRNGNGHITREEWLAMFERASKGKAYLSVDDVADAFYTPPPQPRPEKGPDGKPKRPEADPEDPTRWTLLKGLFNGEIGSRFEGPHVGEAAPDFTLQTQDGAKFVTLSESRGKKPVVLIFGSFT